MSNDPSDAVDDALAALRLAARSELDYATIVLNPLVKLSQLNLLQQLANCLWHEDVNKKQVLPEGIRLAVERLGADILRAAAG